MAAVGAAISKNVWRLLKVEDTKMHIAAKQTTRAGVLPEEGREVAPVLRVYALHVVLELLAARLHLPLQPRLIAELLCPCDVGLHAERVGS